MYIEDVIYPAVQLAFVNVIHKVSAFIEILSFRLLIFYFLHNNIMIMLISSSKTLCKHHDHIHRVKT